MDSPPHLTLAWSALLCGPRARLDPGIALLLPAGRLCPPSPAGLPTASPGPSRVITLAECIHSHGVTHTFTGECARFSTWTSQRCASFPLTMGRGWTSRPGGAGGAWVDRPSREGSHWLTSHPTPAAQRSAQELPLVEKQSAASGPVLGGKRMVLSGHNFLQDSKVIFVEKAPGISS